MQAIFLTLLTLSAAIQLRAGLITKPVMYEHNGAKLTGYLAYDDSVTAKGKSPGVLVFHEWWGLNDYIKSRADQLAKMGYVAFAADMYGDGQSTTDPGKAEELSSQFYGNSLMPERAQAGLDQLLKTGLIDESKIAAIGFCFGGATSLALAYTGAPLAGVVTFHGALLPPPTGAGEKTKVFHEIFGS
jgi:dienelactone hydrolase